MGLTLIAILTGAMLLPGIVAAHFFYRAGKTGEVDPLVPALGSPTGIAQVGALSVIVHVAFVAGLWAVSQLPHWTALPLANPYRFFRDDSHGLVDLTDAFALMSGLSWLMLVAVVVGRGIGELYMRLSNRSIFYGPMNQLVIAADGPNRFITAYVLTKIEHEGAILGYEGVVENLARAFGEVKAVRDVSFVAEPGTVTALIGPNGSGKTTLLLMLASLLRPDSGTIRIAGFDPVADTAAVRSRLGWMPDLLGSWSALTVRATLETTARLYRMDAAMAVARAEELISLVGLEHLAAQPTRVLSRGQKQRLSLARALVHEPTVLLLDEPASGLDPQARVELRQLVRRVASEGTAVLISSHVLAELDEMADGAVYLRQGVTASAESVERTRSTVRPWRIRAADRAALESALLTAGVDASAIVVDRDELLVPLQGETAASALLTTLIAAGVAISTFAPAVGELEHTYLDLNRGGLE